MQRSRIKMADLETDGHLYISSSGGVDSTVLTHIVRSLLPHVPIVFVDTGLEYPENREQIRQQENVVWLRPKKRFQEIIAEYGYPAISKDVSQKIMELRTTQSDVLRQHGNIKNVLKPKLKRMLLLKRDAQNNGRVYGESRNFSE